MERKQFTFFASFASAIQRIEEPASRAVAYDAIVNYALFQEEPPADAPSCVGIVFDLVKPTLDASRRKAENGMAGGKAKQTASKAEANRKQNESKLKQTESKPKANASEKENEKEGEKEKENECSLPQPPLTEGVKPEEKFSGDLLAAVQEWLAYKQEKHQPYKPTGLTSLLTQIRKGADEYGEAAMADVIRSSMASNYMGIMFDRLKTPASRSSNKITTAANYKPPAATASKVEQMKRGLERLGLGGDP